MGWEQSCQIGQCFITKKCPKFHEENTVSTTKFAGKIGLGGGTIYIYIYTHIYIYTYNIHNTYMCAFVCLHLCI